MEEQEDEEDGDLDVAPDCEQDVDPTSSPPLTDHSQTSTLSDFTFHVAAEDWQSLLDRSRLSRCGKLVILGSGWRALLVDPMDSKVPYCHFDRTKLSTPKARLVGCGLYLSFYLECSKQRADGQKCNVRYNVYRSEPFDPKVRYKAEDMEVSALLVDGDPETSHLDPESGKPLYHRRRIMGSLRNKLKAQFASSNKTLKQIVQDMSLEAESGGALKTGDLTLAPTRSAITHMVKEERRKSQLHENPVYAVHLWEQNIRKDEELAAGAKGRPLPKISVRGFVQELIWDPLGIIMYQEKAVRLAHRIFTNESVVFSDASGALVPDIGSKKVFLYVVLAESVADPSLNISTPLLYFLSTDHRIERIRHAISLFLTTIQSRSGGRFLKPTVSVTDDGAALVEATCRTFNSMQVFEYIHFCYEVVSGWKTLDEISAKTRLHICGWHAIKSFPLPGGRTQLQRRINTQWRRLLGVLLMAESMERLQAVIALICFFASARYRSTDLVRGLATFEDVGSVSGKELEEELVRMEEAEAVAAEEERGTGLGDESVPWFEDAGDAGNLGSVVV